MGQLSVEGNHLGPFKVRKTRELEIRGNSINCSEQLGWILCLDVKKKQSWEEEMKPVFQSNHLSELYQQ